MMRRLAFVVLSFALWAAVTPVAFADPDENEPEAVLEEGQGFPAFNESQGCGPPSTSNPLATQTGSLPDSELVRGFKGGFFGRSIGDIRDQLVAWEVPGSGGYTVNLHERVLPALEMVSANLAAEAANGNVYSVRSAHTFGFNARTVSGVYSISNHGLGTAIDVNSTTNPYRGDNVLITDMPAWFVKAWTDAGFCWGGDWINVKDPMHFSWMGPDATPGYGEVPVDAAPKTASANFTNHAASYDLQFGTLDQDSQYVLADATGNGLADVYQVTSKTFGLQMDWSRSHRRHDWCAVDRAAVVGVDFGGRTALYGDYERNGRLDLWLIDDSEATLEIEIVLRSESFEESVTVASAIPALANDLYLLGDHDRDGFVDLFAVRRSASDTSIEVWSGADGFQTALGSFATPLGDTRDAHFALGDRDLDDLPDIFVLDDGTLRIAPNGYGTVTEAIAGPETAATRDLAISDYDGDGRGDLFVLDAGGTLDVYLGNTSIPGAPLTSWFVAANWACNGSESVYNYEGLFRDDEGSVHEDDIDELGGLGITKGCNPPFDDEFCPGRSVSRGEMAAFLDRALALPDATGDFFVDDNASIFQDNINRLAAAGITFGCNPPSNDRFCPGDNVSRAQMAAFLVRAFAFSEGAGDDRFVDDNGSLFEDDIDKLGAAGVTLGCNPPVNDRYCPLNNVTRAEMASFIVRALRTIEA
jgi:hypothetical protein